MARAKSAKFALNMLFEGRPSDRKDHAGVTPASRRPRRGPHSTAPPTEELFNDKVKGFQERLEQNREKLREMGVMPADEKDQGKGKEEELDDEL